MSCLFFKEVCLYLTLISSCTVYNRSNFCAKYICLCLFFPSDKPASDKLNTSLDTLAETDEGGKNETRLG